MRTLILLWASAAYSNYTVSQYVDDLEPMLALNRETYLSGPHTAARRDAALRYFDQQWNWLKSSQRCGSKLLGAPGQRCLSDRARDGKWPWETYYRDPIADAKSLL